LDVRPLICGACGHATNDVVPWSDAEYRSVVTTDSRVSPSGSARSHVALEMDHYANQKLALCPTGTSLDTLLCTVQLKYYPSYIHASVPYFVEDAPRRLRLRPRDRPNQQGATSFSRTIVALITRVESLSCIGFSAKAFVRRAFIRGIGPLRTARRTPIDMPSSYSSREFLSWSLFGLGLGLLGALLAYATQQQGEPLEQLGTLACVRPRPMAAQQLARSERAQQSYPFA
jgi:hypothetical protein